MRKVLAACIGVGALLAANPAAANGSRFMGEVFPIGSSHCPNGAIAADGRLLNIGRYYALHHVLGTRYGGDGKATFALPDIKMADFGAKNARVQWCVSVMGIFPSSPESEQ